MSVDDRLFGCYTGAPLSRADWHAIFEHSFAALAAFLGLPLELNDEPSIDDAASNGGFHAWFTVTGGFGGPLALRAHGTFGVDAIGGDDGTYPVLQGFLYLYSRDLRIGTTRGDDHLHLAYLRADAADHDWTMRGCTGVGQWRIRGWQATEFEGDDGGTATWPHD